MPGNSQEIVIDFLWKCGNPVHKTPSMDALYDIYILPLCKILCIFKQDIIFRWSVEGNHYGACGVKNKHMRY